MGDAKCAEKFILKYKSNFYIIFTDQLEQRVNLICCPSACLSISKPPIIFPYLKININYIISHFLCNSIHVL